MGEKSLKKNAIYSFIRAFMSLVFPVLTFPYASRILMPDGIGKVNFANSVVSYFIIIAGLGIGTYATREAAKIRNNRIELTKFVKEILVINSISTLISYIFFFLALFFIPKLFDYRAVLLICSCKLLFTILGIDWFFTAIEEFKYITLRSVFFQGISLFFLFSFVRDKNDIGAYAMFGIISSVGSNLYNLFYCTKFIDIRQKNKLELKKHIKPIFTFFGMTAVTSVYTMLDTVMLGFLSTDTEVGYYSAATKLNHMVLSLVTAVTAVLLPRMSLYIQNNDTDSFNMLSEKSLSITVLFSAPLAVGLFLLAESLTLLFSGSDYIPAVIPMQIMTPIIFVISVASVTGTRMLPAMNKEKFSLVSYVLGATCNVTLNALLIPAYGALGAAIATLVAESCITFVQIVFLRKYILKKTQVINLLQSGVAIIFLILVVILTKRMLPNPVLQIVCSALLGAFVYVCVLTTFKNKYLIEYFHILKSRLSKHKRV